MSKLKIVYESEKVINETCESWYFEDGFLYLTIAGDPPFVNTSRIRIAYNAKDIFYVEEITDEES